MRLIDADKLLNTTPESSADYNDGLWFPKDGYTPEQIKDAPTVRAIPEDIVGEIRADIYRACVNMAGDYNGLWVKYSDAIDIINKHIM